MVVLQHMHLKLPNFFNSITATISPIPEKVNIFDSIIPKLELKENQYQLKKESSLIPQVLAAGSFDQAASYVVVNYDTGDILAQKDSEKRLSVASLTKIMTSVIALDLADPEDRFMASEKAANIEPTKIGVVSGQSLTLKELLNAALMT